MKRWISLVAFLLIVFVVGYSIFKATTILTVLVGVGVVSISGYLALIADSLDALKEKKVKKTTKQ